MRTPDVCLVIRNSGYMYLIIWIAVEANKTAI